MEVVEFDAVVVLVYFEVLEEAVASFLDEEENEANNETPAALTNHQEKT